jgi:hypothetical protein
MQHCAGCVCAGHCLTAQSLLHPLSCLLPAITPGCASPHVPHNCCQQRYAATEVDASWSQPTLCAQLRGHSLLLSAGLLVGTQMSMPKLTLCSDTLCTLKPLVWPMSCCSCSHLQVQAHGQTDAGRQINRWTDRQTQGQANWQTGRQMETQQFQQPVSS